MKVMGKGGGKKTGDDGGTTESARPCTACRGALRFSHREYAGKGGVRVVLRCRACGAVESHAASASSDDDKSRMRSRKPPVDEGPPLNTVLDSETARRLLEQLRGDDPGSS